MPSRQRANKPRLSQGLDREVFQIVRKIADEQDQYEQGQGGGLSSHAVYDIIRRSNSSLNRKSKKLLEDSIERVLAVIREGEPDDGEGSGSASDVLDGPARGAGVESGVNTLNRSIVGSWSTQRPTEPEKPTVTDQAPPRKQPRMKATVPHLANPELVRSSAATPRDREVAGEPPAKRRKDGKGRPAADRPPPKGVSLADLGGVDAVIHELTELIALPMLFPEVYNHSGIQPPRGVLLHGPPGCGKTLIANAFAAELGVSYIPISAPSIVSGMSGESEKKLREYFDEARRMAPCLMFIDEIDAITPKRESAQREMEKRIVAQMLTCMDDLALEKTNGKPVIILAATNRPDSLDPALRRAGRFNKEINLSVPDESGRDRILKALTRNLKLGGAIDFAALAKMTPGYVGADLNDLVSTAGVGATKRMFSLLKRDLMELELDEETETASSEVRLLRDLVKRSSQALSTDELGAISITHDDFLTALPKIQPSSQREGFATVPNVTWADVGALHSVRDELQMAVVEPIKRPERYERVGIVAPTGVLLWGPPGCGKTLLAKAVANESKANFISVKGPELLNKYVGESERAVRQVFVRARSSVPCIVFFDELDAIVPRREDSSSEASARVVNTLLTELDGLSSRAGIYVIAATNRPDIIDPAMLRPGRLGTLLFVDLPGPEERVEILRTLMKVATTADLDAIARRCHGFSGADLESLLRAAGIAALRREADLILPEDFEDALCKVKRSVGADESSRYRRLRGQWG
ncbi:MAG: hypothetical protein M1826_004955 [Phylliscum demangeonii]|nr:MAG: hypothetical protein M1826_004955 [Phylliscum demangeonii]